jgi:hypothetical protein
MRNAVRGQAKRGLRAGHHMGMRVVAVLCLASAMCFAGSWSGLLVDSKCYATEERNVGPTDTDTAVDRDKGWEIRFCSPRVKTKIFALVRQGDAASFKLDSEGNAQAAELVRNTGKKRYFAVNVTGEISGDTIKVDSVSLRRR